MTDPRHDPSCPARGVRICTCGVTLAPSPDAALREAALRNADLRDALLAARRVFQEHMVRLGRYTGNTHIVTFARGAIEDIDAALATPAAPPRIPFPTGDGSDTPGAAE